MGIVYECNISHMGLRNVGRCQCELVCLEVFLCLFMCLMRLCLCTWMCPSEAVGISLSGGILCRWAGWPLLLLLCEATRKEIKSLRYVPQEVTGSLWLLYHLTPRVTTSLSMLVKNQAISATHPDSQTAEIH